MKKYAQQVTTWIINILFYLCMLALFWVFCQIFLISSFKIPTDSMASEIVAGDNVLVLKPTIGVRLFNLFAVSAGKPATVYRLPGLKKIQRNDVLVFNFPCPRDWSKIEMNLMSYYIKRCIGLPGDTVLIEKGFYKVRGVDGEIGNSYSQRQLNRRAESTIEDGVFRTFPYDSVMGWNIKDFGPLFIPEKGAVIPMNRENYIVYRKVIEWEQQKELSYRDGMVYLDREAIDVYRFQKNYYFMAGDRVEDSQDSRYWGLLPEEYIVGKAWVVWKSIDPYTGEFRWDRFLKRIN